MTCERCGVLETENKMLRNSILEVTHFHCERCGKGTTGRTSRSFVCIDCWFRIAVDGPEDSDVVKYGLLSRKVDVNER